MVAKQNAYNDLQFQKKNVYEHFTYIGKALCQKSARNTPVAEQPGFIFFIAVRENMHHGELRGVSRRYQKGLAGFGLGVSDFKEGLRQQGLLWIGSCQDAGVVLWLGALVNLYLKGEKTRSSLKLQLVFLKKQNSHSYQPGQGHVWSFLQFGEGSCLSVFRHDYEGVLILSGSITVIG